MRMDSVRPWTVTAPAKPVGSASGNSTRLRLVTLSPDKLKAVGGNRNRASVSGEACGAGDGAAFLNKDQGSTDRNVSGITGQNSMLLLTSCVPDPETLMESVALTEMLPASPVLPREVLFSWLAPLRLSRSVLIDICPARPYSPAKSG